MNVWAQGRWFQPRLPGDILGGITAAIVALPLALAFGVSSGAGALAGLYGAIIVGFFAALLGGTSAQISGPTGPLSVVIALIISRFSGDLAMAFTIVFLAGLLQVVFGLMKLGRYVTFIPYKVIAGFMTGIGVLIIVMQIAPVLGFKSPASIVRALNEIPAQVAGLNPDALAVAVLCFLVILFWPKAWGRYMPAPLLALFVGALAAHFFFPAAPILGPVPTELPSLHLPHLDMDELSFVMQSAMMLALLGSIDSLLTSLVADNLTRDQHNSNRELIGQGIGNALAGLMGGIAGAGATVRTVVNVRGGGVTPLSGVIHAIFLLGVLMGLGRHLAGVPLAALAAVLLKVGIDIIDWQYLRRLPRCPREIVVVVITVIVLTVFVDLITAVMVGLVMHSLVSAERLGAEQMKNVELVSSDDEPESLSDAVRAVLRTHVGQVLLLRLSGPFSFGSASDLLRRTTLAATEYQVIVFDFKEVPYVDASIAMTLESLLRRISEDGKTAVISGLSAEVDGFLRQMKILSRADQSHCFGDLDRAMVYVDKHLNHLARP